MPDRLTFSMAFNVGRTNQEREEACRMYQEAFGAKRLSQSSASGGDVHIMMDFCGLPVMLAPGGKVEKTTENAMCCEFRFDREEALRHAYEVLSQDSLSHSIDSYPWAPVGALVTDKYGVCWWLRT